MGPLFAAAALSLLGYHLTFDSEMNSPADMSQFINTFVNGDTTLYNNHEAENYVAFNPAIAGMPFAFANGAMVITATPTPAGNQPYSSGLLETAGIYTQSGGYFEIRAATPASQGFWPAFWLLPYAYYPEIDILEQPNNSGTNTEYWTHTSTPSDSSGGFTDTGVDVTQGYHTYGFLWTPSSIQYVFDGQLVGYQHDLPPALVGEQMYMIANLAVGGQYSWPGQPPMGATSTYSIDYVRAYSNDPSVPAVAFQPLSSPDGVNTVPVLSQPAVKTPAVIGVGADTLVLSVSEDAFMGDAQFTISVDGHQRGGVLTTQASHAFGQPQLFTVKGTFGLSRHIVSVNFLNDAYGSDGDRNLYVTAATINGHPIIGAKLNDLVNGPQSFGFINKPVQPVAIGSGPDVLQFSLSSVPHTANARFSVAVDGVIQSVPQVVSALHAYGQTQIFAVAGNFGPAAHTVMLSFIGGAAAGATTDPVDLYVDALSYNGVAIPLAAKMFSAAGKYVIKTPAQSPDTLSLSLTEDPWEGDALAEISVDSQVIGLVTVTANNAFGLPQVISYSGSWGGANVPHIVTVTFLNDLYGGSGQDRNLHVQNITLDGTPVTTKPQNMMLSGPADFAYPVPVGSAGWVPYLAARRT